MNWKLFWKVVRITFGSLILIAAVIMLFCSLFMGSGIDIAYCMFALLTFILGLIMVVFGVASLPRKQ